MNDHTEISNTGQTPDTNRLLLGIETLIEKLNKSIAIAQQNIISTQQK